jgi:formylglycine-generating enzyme required for sulfatase activity
MRRINFILSISTISLFMSCGKENGLDSPTNPNGNNWHPPVVTGITPSKTTTVVNDTMTITAAAMDNGAVVKYVWAKNNAPYYDTTTIGSLKTAFSDTGRTTISVKVMDNDNLWSQTAGICSVFVRAATAPVIKAMVGKSVNIKDTITITATATNNSAIQKYVWTKVDEEVSETTSTGSLTTCFTIQGRNIVQVKAQDDHGLWSAPDTLKMNVTLDAPILTPHHDTVVSQNMSVMIQVSAKDTNKTGSIKKYYWDIGGNGWDDSTDVPSKNFSNSAGGTVPVILAARDNDGVMSGQDRFFIHFNRPPGIPSISSPLGKIAWSHFNFSTGKGTVPLSLSSIDPDGPEDTLTFSLFLGASASSLTSAYSGKSPLYNALNIDSGATVYWRLIVKDLYADSASATGSFVAPQTAPPGMIRIAGGVFQMGLQDWETIHTVTVSPFWMDTIEVTQADYQSLMGMNPSHFQANKQFPIDSVFWNDAARYCNARSNHDGLDSVYFFNASTWDADTSKNGYRLPTEAQWEYACRGGTTTDFYWGSDSVKADENAWYAYNAKGTTHTGAQKMKNAFGLYDMAGNVAEWCNDWYGNYDSVSVANPLGPKNGTDKVFRGGCWKDNDFLNLRCGRRFSYSATQTGASVGFRVALPVR